MSDPKPKLIDRLALPETASGLMLMLPHLVPALAPIQLVALLPVLWTLTSPATSVKRALRCGIWMGLAYTIPQMIALRLPPGLTIALTALLMAVLTLFCVGAWRLMRQLKPVVAAFGMAALLGVLDWLNFSAFGVWGTAQSLARPWSHYPRLISFLPMTGISALVYGLCVLQALAIVAMRFRRLSRPTIALAANIVAFTVAVFVGESLKPTPTNGRTLRVAAIGWTAADDDNIGVRTATEFKKLVIDPVASAANQGAKLVVLPELGFVYGGGDRTAWLSKFAVLAKRHRIHLAIGYLQMRGQLNRMVFVDPNGMEVGVYTKTHLIPGEPFDPGEGKPTVIAMGDGVRLGGMICQDDNFIDISSRYARQGVHLMAVPTLDWPAVKSAHFQNSLFRPMEAGYALVRAARNGISAIVSPDGVVIAKLDHCLEGAGVIVGDVGLGDRRSGPGLLSLFGHWPVAAMTVYLIACLLWSMLPQRLQPCIQTFGNRQTPGKPAE